MKETDLKIKRVSVVNQVFDTLKQYILDGNWKVGEKIPSENELSKIFGVNRLSVRLALQRLITLGLIETKIGDGSYITNFSVSTYFNEVSDIYLSQKKFDDIFELRKLIELDSSRLAIEKASTEEIEVLKNLAEKYNNQKIQYQETQTAEDLETLVEYDLNFHYQICIMSHNSIYPEVFSLIKEGIRKYLYKIIKAKSEQQSTKKEYTTEEDSHILIYNAISEKNYKACEEAYLNTIKIDSLQN